MRLLRGGDAPHLCNDMLAMQADGEQESLGMNTTRLLRCVLVLCLWQGPLPVWHAHGTLADASEASQAWLADHLATHHAAVDPCEHLFFGWHLHFEVPESDGEPNESPSTSLRLPAVAAASGSALRFETRCLSACSLNTSDLLTSLGPVRPVIRPGVLRRGFFTDDGGRLSLPLRLGVARC